MEDLKVVDFALTASLFCLGVALIGLGIEFIKTWLSNSTYRKIEKKRKEKL